jgi:hypothetical protein
VLQLLEDLLGRGHGWTVVRPQAILRP